MDYTAKTCNNCEHAIKKPVWLFFNRWYCRHPNVRAAINPVGGESVRCDYARNSHRSPCGVSGSCYNGPADFKPDPARPMSYQSSYSMTMAMPTSQFFQTNRTNSAMPMLSRGVGFSTSPRDDNFLPGVALGMMGAMLAQDNDSPTTSVEEPWSGGGGDMSGGGASDSWDSGSDSGGGDSGGSDD